MLRRLSRLNHIFFICQEKAWGMEKPFCYGWKNPPLYKGRLVGYFKNIETSPTPPYKGGDF
jgi:hypothetical protein